MGHIKDNNTRLIHCMILSFSIPVIIMIMSYYEVGIYPGGLNTILTFDLQSQYMSFFASLRTIGSSDNSIFFTMSGALGNNFMGFAYYIFSPFTWMTALASLESLPIALYITFLLRIGMCGMGFCYYLLYSFKDKHFIGAVLLACCYALTSYNIGYSVNLMWLDVVLVLPWILVGVERVIRKKKHGLLVAMITFSLICNYYISFMALIFVALYSMVRLIECCSIDKTCHTHDDESPLPQKSFDWIIGRIVCLAYSALIGLGLSMPIVLPGIIALKYGKMGEEHYPIKSLFRYRFLDVMGQLFSGKYDTVFDDGLPLIFCGTGTLVLVLLFFADRRYNIRTKIFYGAFIVFYLFTMCFIPFDRVMHGFQETTCFEVRYAFAFCCLLLIVAYKGIDCFVILMRKFGLSRWVKYIIGAFVIIELTMNSLIIVSKLMVELHYRTYQEYGMILDAKTSLLDEIDDKGFYRVSDDNGYTNNDGAWLGYNGFGYFSSCYNLALMNYLGDLGESQYYHILNDHDRTPLEESLLGAKYKLSYAAGRKTDEVIGEHGLYTISRNNDALSLGYMVDFSDGNSVDISGNAFENQNNLAKELSGIEEPVFVELEPMDCQNVYREGIEDGVSFNVITKEAGQVWLYVELDKNQIGKPIADKAGYESKVMVNGNDKGGYRQRNMGLPYALYLGDYSAQESLEIEVSDIVKIGKVHVVNLDDTVYKSVINALKQNEFDITEHSGGHFSGSVDAGEGGSMFLSLPFIGGWHIRVDGDETKYFGYRDIFVMVPIPKGRHEIDIQFISPGFKTGVLIGFLSLMILALVTYKNYNVNEPLV